VTAPPAGAILSEDRGVFWTTKVTSSLKIGENLTYYYLSDVGVLIISGSGPMYPALDEASDYPWNTYRSSVSTVILTPDITAVTPYAFQNFDNENVRVPIPSKLTSVGRYAYSNANTEEVADLTQAVTIGDHAFEDTDIEGTVYLTSCTSLGTHAFQRTDVTEVTLGSSLTSVGESAFYLCDGLATVISLCDVSALERNTDCFHTEHTEGTVIYQSYGEGALENDSRYDSALNSYLYLSVCTIYLYESGQRMTSYNVDRGSAVVLPAPGYRAGYTFTGWYADAGLTVPIGPAGGIYNASVSTTLYAGFIRDTIIAISWSYYLDGSPSDKAALSENTDNLDLPGLMTAETYAVVSPSAGYAFTLSSTDAFIEQYGDLYRITVKNGASDVSIDVFCDKVTPGPIAITALTQEGRGAAYDLSSVSVGGLMSGKLHFGGVYVKEAGDGTLLYGAVSDSLLQVYDGSGYVTMDTGIDVVSGRTYQEGAVRLADSGSVFHSVYACYEHANGVIVSPTMYGGCVI